jgi:predicted MFS family arabinose efflux permease
MVMLLIAIRISPFQALSSELVNSVNRGSLMSLLVSFGNIGSGIAGILAGYLYISAGYFSNTIFGGVTIILTAFLVWKYVPEPEFKPID